MVQSHVFLPCDHNLQPQSGAVGKGAVLGRASPSTGEFGSAVGNLGLRGALPRGLGVLGLGLESIWGMFGFGGGQADDKEPGMALS